MGFSVRSRTFRTEPQATGANTQTLVLEPAATHNEDVESRFDRFVAGEVVTVDVAGGVVNMVRVSVRYGGWLS